MNQAENINIYFSDATKLFAFENNEAAGLAALTAAKVAAEIQRKSMVEYVIGFASDIERFDEDASNRMLLLSAMIMEKDWSILDITLAKQELASVDKSMAKALDAADSKFFRVKYESFFKMFENGVFLNSNKDKTATTKTILEKPVNELKMGHKTTSGASARRSAAPAKTVKKIIQTPKRAYYNSNFIIQYEVDVGDKVRAGDLILRLIDANETIGIAANHDTVLSRIFIRNGQRIDRSQMNLCEIDEYEEIKLSNSDYEWKQIDVNINDTQKNYETKNGLDIEERLNKLRDLYNKQLISKKIYEERQAEIIKDL